MMSLSLTSMTEVEAWLLEPSSQPEVNKVERMQNALFLLENPQEDLPVIHVTGTNGKGSTIKILEALFSSQNLQVGTFTSPHLERVNERIMRNRQEISDQDFIFYANQICKLERQMRQGSWGSLGFFERYVLLACLYFRDHPVDVLLMEVGIGGRFDASNIFDQTLSVITTVGLDHSDLLGETIPEIADQKAGIIRPQSRTVQGLLPQLADQVIRDRVLETEGHLWTSGQDFKVSAWNYDLSQQGMVMDWSFPTYDLYLSQVQVHLLGQHQVDNTSLALAVFVIWLRDQGWEVNWSLAREALSQIHWWGRMEQVQEDPVIYLDGAHNQPGIQSLIQTLSDTFHGDPITILYAGLDRKDQASHLRLLADLPQVRLLVTTFDHPDACQIKDFRQMDPTLETCLDWRAFLSDWNQDADQALILTGSLYFIAQARQFLTRRD